MISAKFIDKVLAFFKLTTLKKADERLREARENSDKTESKRKINGEGAHEFKMAK